VRGVERLGTDETGYGPPGLVAPAGVKAISAALAELTLKYDAARLEDAYPKIWREPDASEWLNGSLATLRSVSAWAAAENHGVLWWLC
jgi:hypothetical protein